MCQCRDVEVDDLELAVEIRLVEVPVRADARVVHERMNPLVQRPDSRGEMLAIEPAREIRGKRVTRHAIALAQRSRNRLECLASARDEQQIVPITCEQIGEIDPDSARRARDDRERAVLAASRRCQRRCGNSSHVSSSPLA